MSLNGEAKARSKLAKHGVSFVAARVVFGDLIAIERLDSGGEPAGVRYVITGMATGVLLAVVCTERSDRIRIISARKATKHEQEEYYRSRTAD